MDGLGEEHDGSLRAFGRFEEDGRFELTFAADDDADSPRLRSLQRASRRLGVEGAEPGTRVAVRWEHRRG